MVCVADYQKRMEMKTNRTTAIHGSVWRMRWVHLWVSTYPLVGQTHNVACVCLIGGVDVVVVIAVIESCAQELNDVTIAFIAFKISVAGEPSFEELYWLVCGWFSMRTKHSIRSRCILKIQIISSERRRGDKNLIKFNFFDFWKVKWIGENQNIKTLIAFHRKRFNILQNLVCLISIKNNGQIESELNTTNTGKSVECKKIKFDVQIETIDAENKIRERSKCITSLDSGSAYINCFYCSAVCARAYTCFGYKWDLSDAPSLTD